MKRVVILLFLLLFGSAAAFSQDVSETEKIQYLIALVENLQDAKFIRNGTEYDAKQAADHLRLKLKKAGGRVKTANDFINFCASRSFLSGEPYRIKFKDASVAETGVFLRDKLSAFVQKRP